MGMARRLRTQSEQYNTMQQQQTTSDAVAASEGEKKNPAVPEQQTSGFLRAVNKNKTNSLLGVLK